MFEAVQPAQQDRKQGSSPSEDCTVTNTCSSNRKIAQGTPARGLLMNRYSQKAECLPYNQSIDHQGDASSLPCPNSKFASSFVDFGVSSTFSQCRLSPQGLDVTNSHSQATPLGAVTLCHTPVPLTSLLLPYSRDDPLWRCGQFRGERCLMRASSRKLAIF